MKLRTGARAAGSAIALLLAASASGVEDGLKIDSLEAYLRPLFSGTPVEIVETLQFVTFAERDGEFRGDVEAPPADWPSRAMLLRNDNDLRGLMQDLRPMSDRIALPAIDFERRSVIYMPFATAYKHLVPKRLLQRDDGLHLYVFADQPGESPVYDLHLEHYFIVIEKTDAANVYVRHDRFASTPTGVMPPVSGGISHEVLDAYLQRITTIRSCDRSDLNAACRNLLLYGFTGSTCYRRFCADFEDAETHRMVFTTMFDALTGEKDVLRKLIIAACAKRFVGECRRHPGTWRTACDESKLLLWNLVFDRYGNQGEMEFWGAYYLYNCLLSNPELQPVFERHAASEDLVVRTEAIAILLSDMESPAAIGYALDGASLCDVGMPVRFDYGSRPPFSWQGRKVHAWCAGGDVMVSTEFLALSPARAARLIVDCPESRCFEIVCGLMLIRDSWYYGIKVFCVEENGEEAGKREANAAQLDMLKRWWKENSEDIAVRRDPTLGICFERQQ